MISYDKKVKTRVAFNTEHHWDVLACGKARGVTF